jgi:hypothetical protein
MFDEYPHPVPPFHASASVQAVAPRPHLAAGRTVFNC